MTDHPVSAQEPLAALLHEIECKPTGLALHDAGDPDAVCGSLAARLATAGVSEPRATNLRAELQAFGERLAAEGYGWEAIVTREGPSGEETVAHLTTANPEWVSVPAEPGARYRCRFGCCTANHPTDITSGVPAEPGAPDPIQTFSHPYRAPVVIDGHEYIHTSDCEWPVPAPEPSALREAARRMAGYWESTGGVLPSHITDIIAALAATPQDPEP